MEVISFTTHKNQGLLLQINTIQMDFDKKKLFRFSVKKHNVRCQFCSQSFDSIALKNAHILDHFEQELCDKCGQHLLHIGENVYVLHGTITCVDTKVEQKTPKDIKASSFCWRNDFYDEQCQTEFEKATFIDCDQEESDDYSVDSEANNKSIDSIEDFKPKSEKQEQRNKHEETKRPRIEKNPLKIEVVENSTDGKMKEKYSQSALESNQGAPLHENPKLSLPRKRKRRKPLNETFFKCEHKGCDKLLKSRNKKQHLASHKSERFECDICHASLASKTGLRAHFYLHYPIKELKCHVCGAEFRSPSSLNQHLRFIHYNEPKKFICNICGRALRKNHLLREHMNKHMGKKPFGCSHNGCEKRFYSKAHRNEHMRSHTGEKPFKCTMEGCDRQYAYAIDYKRHKFKAHGIFTNKYNCTICLKIFPENMLLKKHMKMHHNQIG